MQKVFENESHIVFFDGKSNVKVSGKTPFVPVFECVMSDIGHDVWLAIAGLKDDGDKKTKQTDKKTKEKE